MSSFDPSHVDVEHFLDTLGLENVSKATQQEMRFSCPFPNHASGDESPSAYMNLDSGRFFCHGCKEKGDASDMAAYVLQISPLESRRLLKAAYQPGAINPDMRNMVSEVEKILGQTKTKIVQPVVHENFLIDRELDWQGAFSEYQKDRGFVACDHFFERGFSPETLTEWEFGWDDRTGRVCFPIRDYDGTLIGFKARAHDDRKPKYLVLGDGPGQGSWGFQRYYPSHVVFGAHRYRECDQPLIVCEGELNAIATTQKTGLPAVAINGSFFQHHHAKIIRKISGPAGVILFFDEDKAGLECTWGREDSKGDWHPGVVDLLSPHMPVQLVPSHDQDAADMDPDALVECVRGAQTYLFALMDRQ